MKAKIQRYLFLAHSYIEKFFYRLTTETILPILVMIFGISSWAYPVFNIWGDVIDRESSLVKFLVYVVIGTTLLYTSLSFDAILRKLKEEKERIKNDMVK